MDSFGERGQMLGNIEALLQYNKEQAKAPTNQDSLFGLMTNSTSVPTLKLAPVPEASSTERLGWEKELLGLYLSGHPLEKYRAMLEKREVTIGTLKATPKEGQVVVLGGLIDEIRPIATKKGDNMLFMKLTDFTGTLEVVVFPRVLAEFKNILLPEACVAIKGKISLRNGEVSMLAEKVKKL